MREPLTLSTTAFGHASRCLRQYQYTQVDRLALPPARLSPRMRLGIWIHRALEFEGKNLGWLNGLTECYDWCIAHGVPAEACDAILARAKDLIPAYLAYWASQKHLWTVLASEIVLTKALSNGDTLRATLDKIVKIDSGGPFAGRTFIVEHKTTSDIPGPGWRVIDPQTAMQFALARANTWQIDGILFDYILTREPSVPRVKLDGRFYANTAITTSHHFRQALAAVQANWKGTATEMQQYIQEQQANLVSDATWFQRYYVFRPRDAVRESMQDVASVLRALHEAQESGHYRRNFNLMYCPMMCPVRELCSSEYALGGVNKGLRETEYVIDNPDDREGRA